jgi:hypothetical protein
MRTKGDNDNNEKGKSLKFWGLVNPLLCRLNLRQEERSACIPIEETPQISILYLAQLALYPLDANANYQLECIISA